jgi:hypothetical protein
MSVTLFVYSLCENNVHDAHCLQLLLHQHSIIRICFELL